MDPTVAAAVIAALSAIIVALIGVLVRRRAAALDGGGGPRVTAVIEGGGSATVQQHQALAPGDTGRFPAVSPPPDTCHCRAALEQLDKKVTDFCERLDALKAEALDRLDEAHRGWRDDTRQLALTVAAVPPELQRVARAVEDNNALARRRVE